MQVEIDIESGDAEGPCGNYIRSALQYLIQMIQYVDTRCIVGSRFHFVLMRFLNKDKSLLPWSTLLCVYSSSSPLSVGFNTNNDKKKGNG